VLLGEASGMMPAEISPDALPLDAIQPFSRTNALQPYGCLRLTKAIILARAQLKVLEKLPSAVRATYMPSQTWRILSRFSVLLLE